MKEKKVLDNGKRLLHYLDEEGNADGNQILLHSDGTIHVRRKWKKDPRFKHSILVGVARWRFEDGEALRIHYNKDGEVLKRISYNSKGQITHVDNFR